MTHPKVETVCLKCGEITRHYTLQGTRVGSFIAYYNPHKCKGNKR